MVLLARTIHERFCCNRGLAAATSLATLLEWPGEQAHEQNGRLTDSAASTSVALIILRAVDLRDFATKRHERCGLMGEEP